ncbi:O-antigen polymerase [Vibrio cyclitrophicus]
MRRFYLSPLVIFFTSWLLALFLYNLRISKQFIFDFSTIISVLSYVLLPFLFCYVFIATLSISSQNFKLKTHFEIPFLVEKKVITRWFLFWMFVTFIEVLISGGIPIFWYMTGSSKTYFDFGVKGLHGLMNALLLTLSVLSFITYMVKKESFFLLFSLFIIFWGVIVVARQLVVVYLIEIMFVYCLFNTTRAILLSLYKLLFFIFIGIIAFGLIGDLRNGRDVIISISSLNVDYPDWMPSGFLWVYMYITTPLNNLFNAFVNLVPNYDFSFSKTLSSLIPSFLRNLIFGTGSAFEREWLYVSSFTVSTGFINPFVDMGKVGVTIISSIIGLLSAFSWYKTKSGFIFINAVLLQCLVLSVFVNHFLYLPVSFQLFWYFFIVKKMRFD